MNQAQQLIEGVKNFNNSLTDKEPEKVRGWILKVNCKEEYLAMADEETGYKITKDRNEAIMYQDFQLAIRVAQSEAYGRDFRLVISERVKV